MKQYTPNPKIIDRSVAIWIQMLECPKYDNLGRSSSEPPESKRACEMASIMESMTPKNNTTPVLQKFGEELKKILTTPQPEGYFIDSLHVDYHPDGHLAEAAKLAGLEMEFPWKTNMFIMSDYVCVSNGYAEPKVYHYPLANDQWLVVKLSGEDIQKVIALVNQGVITPDLTAH